VILMVALTAFYLYGQQVTPGQEIVMDPIDARGTESCGFAKPIGPVPEDA
jgi:hypothetical protein